MSRFPIFYPSLLYLSIFEKQKVGDRKEGDSNNNGKNNEGNIDHGNCDGCGENSTHKHQYPSFSFVEKCRITNGKLFYDTIKYFFIAFQILRIFETSPDMKDIFQVFFNK
jgi:hypothetical protein